MTKKKKKMTKKKMMMMMTMTAAWCCVRAGSNKAAGVVCFGAASPDWASRDPSWAAWAAEIRWSS